MKKIKDDGFMWECECGHIDYGLYPPETCPECSGIDCFTKVPEDLREKKEAENVLALQNEEGDEDD